MIITSLGQRIIVRYARKPIWMPTAPSKLFRIAEHKFYSPEEIKQIFQLDETYKAQERTIQEFMKQEFYVPASQSGGLPVEFIKKEEEIDRRLEEENSQENARIAKLKEEFIGKQIQDMEDRLIDEKLLREEQLIKSAQEVNDYVREHKSNPNRFVTPESIDEMIEKALENTVLYEYYINIQGKKTRSIDVNNASAK